MNKHAKSREFLAAIDLDGTLLGPDGRVGEDNRAAIEVLWRRGGTLVLASGRHPQNMADFAASLPQVSWLVGCQGCEVSDARRGRVLTRDFLPSAEVIRWAEVGREAGFGVVAYTVDHEITPWDGPEVARYRSISLTEIVTVDPGVLSKEPIFKIMWVGAESRIDALLEQAAPAGLSGVTATVRSHHSVFEFVPHGITKGSGVALLARELGFAPAEVIGFGDADNDLPLFDWVAHSVAMPHAREHVRARATRVAPVGPPESAFARGVESLLTDGALPGCA